MLFEHRYAGSSGVQQGDAATAMSFVPDTLREPTFFRGDVAKQVEFREAISALHDVVTSDLRFIPKDRTAYLAWREQQSYIDLAQLTASQQRVSGEIAELGRELTALEARSSQRRSAFFAARQKYFNYLYHRDKELWFKLDPVITVHPDQVFFECFSRDESSYGRLAASYEVFEQLGDRACGTTNIDYSEKLYGEFQKIRSYKTTTLDVDPGGFNVQTSMEDQYREVKIDLPDSWVRGFLQVSAAATLPAHVVELHPMDVHNLCLVLRRNKELFGPRSLRFQLVPGAPVSVVVEPWGTRLACPRSRYLESGSGGATEIRVWGRRRLFILERLLPRAVRVRLFLLGTGLPTFWVVDLGDLSFTLGLSGWTHNNWSEAGNFDLMAAREEVDTVTQARVWDELGKSWLATPGELAGKTGLAEPIVASALAGWVQAGRAIFDLDRGVYRKRELTREPLPLEQLRFANPREAAAAQMLHRAKISVDTADVADGGLHLVGRIKDRGRMFAPDLTFDADRRLVAGECSCDFFIRNRLHKGPCEHMLALRAAHRRGISDSITFEAPARSPGGRSGPEAGPLGSVTRGREAAEDRESFQAAFRKAVLRAAELRSAGRLADSIRELDRIAKLAPPDSDEQARLQEVIAESQLEAGEHQAARAAADRALRRLPGSALALRIKRDALVQLDELPAAIQVARALAGVEGTIERWSELVRLCHQVEDWNAMYQFAQEGLRLHPAAPRLVAALEVAAGQGAAATAPPAEPKASWWRRAIGKLTGRGSGVESALAAAAASVDARLAAIADELERRADVVDRRTLIQILRVAHAGSDQLDGKIASMVRALRQTSAVSRLPSDKDLTALLRRILA